MCVCVCVCVCVNAIRTILQFTLVTHGHLFRVRLGATKDTYIPIILAGSLGHGHSTPGAHGSTVLKCCFSTPKLVMLVNGIFTGDSNNLFLEVMCRFFAYSDLKMRHLQKTKQTVF